VADCGLGEAALPPFRHFEHFEHGADVGVRGRGATPAGAFEGAASALFTLVARNLLDVRPAVSVDLACGPAPLDELLVAYLNELLSLADARKLVFGRFEVALEPDGEGRFFLRGRALGEPYDPARHESTVEPKGATFTSLRVAEEDGGWVAQCVVDV
jgi:SHS2 domain-containing protein